MRIGCSLCGWKDLKIYSTPENFIRFVDNVVRSTSTYKYEIPFIPVNNSDLCTLGMLLSSKTYSVHASKNIFCKSEDEIRRYFGNLYDYCSALRCKYVVVHPPNIEKAYKLLQIVSKHLNSICLSIENTEKHWLGFNHLYECEYKLTIDFAHTIFNNHFGVLDSISDELVSHFHVRGFSKETKYVSLRANKEQKIDDLLEKCAKNFSGPLILEYPYSDVLEMKKDLSLLEDRMYEILVQ